MGLTLWSLNRLAAGIDDPIQVGVLSDDVLRKLGWRLGFVYLSRESAVHIKKRHPDITSYEATRIPEFIEKGLIIHQIERNNHVTISFFCGITEKRYTVILKRTKDGNEVYVVSLRR